MQNVVKVGLVEDQPLFRQGMKAILHTWKDIQVVFESADGYTVHDKLKEASVLPDVMLLDLSLPMHGQVEFSGKDVTMLLREHYPEMKVIILSGHDDENFIAQ